ncbi:hypothetical protein YC2023_114065 [Brassica napus]
MSTKNATIIVKKGKICERIGCDIYAFVKIIFYFPQVNVTYTGVGCIFLDTKPAGTTPLENKS